jgi:mRNA interferase RelE/StbE
MPEYRIEFTEEGKADLGYYTAFERKIITSQIRAQLMYEPSVETKNRKSLRENPVASWELRAGKFRVFYEVNEPLHVVVIVSVGHKDHGTLLIQGKEVTL